MLKKWASGARSEATRYLMALVVLETRRRWAMRPGARGDENSGMVTTGSAFWVRSRPQAKHSRTPGITWLWQRGQRMVFYLDLALAV